MPSSVVNRQTLREKLATIIDAGLDSTWDVFSYGTSTFAGKARNVVIASGDTDYPEVAADDDSISTARIDFYVSIFVLYESTSQSWTAQNSENALDLGRKYIADVLKDNYKVDNYWDRLMPSRSRVGVVSDEGGVPYRYEVIPVTILVY